MSSTEIVRCFYTKLDENTYVCKCKAKLTQRKNTGFTNLRAHVLSAHKDYEAQIVTYNSQLKLGFIPSDTVKNVYYWLRTVIMSNLPFSFVENTYVREGSKYDPIMEQLIMLRCMLYFQTKKVIVCNFY